MSRDLPAYVAALDPKHGVYIAGHGRATPTTFDVLDPANGELIAEVANATAAEAAQAVDAAAAAFASWAATPPRKRAEVLHRAFERMVTDVDQLARLIAWENGKSLADARAEVVYAAEFFRWFSEEAVRSDGN
jgi:succinate-semialdehyde dehydrogenase / glutarate-semialdehyde dehydrogenase